MLFGNAFMLRASLSSAWVKNVYRLWGEGVAKCVNSYTALYKTFTRPQLGRVKPTVFTQVLDTFPPSLYTLKFGFLPQENPHLYTVSTAPIIKKKR